MTWFNKHLLNKWRHGEHSRNGQDVFITFVLLYDSDTVLLGRTHFPSQVAAAASLQSCPTLCDPIDGSPPGSPIPGILQARTLEWVAISFSNAWKKSESEVTQLCPTLSDPMDCSFPGSSIHGIFQAGVLEWGAIAFSTITGYHLVFNTSCYRLNIFALPHPAPIYIRKLNAQCDGWY